MLMDNGAWMKEKARERYDKKAKRETVSSWVLSSTEEARDAGQTRHCLVQPLRSSSTVE